MLRALKIRDRNLKSNLTMQNNINYILVDDDPFSNMICSKMIRNTLHTDLIQSFTLPVRALTYIQNTYSTNLNTTVLFLDINMPVINGWMFLEQYDKFSVIIKRQIAIYILTSSLDLRDINRARADKNVKDLISKPLFSQTLLSIAEC